MVNLIVVEGLTRGLVFGLREEPLTVGRSGAADIVLSHDKKVSHFHAKFLPVGPERYVVQDLGSTNGTHVNGEAIEQSPLRVGDRVQIGRTHFVYTDRASLSDVDIDVGSSALGGDSDVPSKTGASVGGGAALFPMDSAPGLQRPPPAPAVAASESAEAASDLATDPRAETAFTPEPAVAFDPRAATFPEPPPLDAAPIAPSKTGDSHPLFEGVKAPPPPRAAPQPPPVAPAVSPRPAPAVPASPAPARAAERPLPVLPKVAPGQTIRPAALPGPSGAAAGPPPSQGWRKIVYRKRGLDDDIGEGPMGTERWEPEDIDAIRESILQLDQELETRPGDPAAPPAAVVDVPPIAARGEPPAAEKDERPEHWTDQEGDADPRPPRALIDLPDPGESAPDLFGVTIEAPSAPADAGPTDTGPSLRLAKLRLESLYRLVRVLTTRHDEQGMIGDVLDIALRAMHAERGAILLIDQPQESDAPPVLDPHVVAWRAPREPGEELTASGERKPFTVSRTILDHSLRDGQAVLISDAAADPRYRGQNSVVLSGVRSALCVPLRGRRLLGAMYVDSREQGRRFSEDDLRFLVAIASQCAVGLEEVRAYNDIVRRSEELAGLDRMKAEFMALVAHELRTPLTNIQSPLELLEGDGGNEAERKELLGVIRSGAERMQRLVRDVTEFLEIASGDRSLVRERVDLVASAHEVVRFFAPKAAVKSVDIKVEATGPLPVIGDQRLLAQVLSRLVDNAVKFTERGRITIFLGRDRDGAPTVSIADSGQGIRPDRLKAVFDSLRTAHDMRHHGGGIGIGLAVVKAVVERHGGQIRVESPGEGHGSTFTFRLPR